MLVRHAFFEGTVAPEDQARFESIVRERIAPGMQRFPRIRRLVYHWGREFEDDDRRFHLVIEHAYDSMQDMAAAITSAPRREIQEPLEEMLALFDGKVFHVNFEMDVVRPG